MTTWATIPYYGKLHRYRQTLGEFCAVLLILNRRTDLERLIEWATRKRLPGPRRLYQSRLMDEETRLVQHTCRSSRLVRWAHVAHWIGGVITPTPRYYSKGSAAIYRHPY